MSIKITIGAAISITSLLSANYFMFFSSIELTYNQWSLLSFEIIALIVIGVIMICFDK